MEVVPRLLAYPPHRHTNTEKQQGLTFERESGSKLGIVELLAPCFTLQVKRGNPLLQLVILFLKCVLIIQFSLRVLLFFSKELQLYGEIVTRSFIDVPFLHKLVEVVSQVGLSGTDLCQVLLISLSLFYDGVVC